MTKFDKDFDLEPTEYRREEPQALQLLAAVVQIVVAVVLTWLLFMPIKNFVQEAVRPYVAAALNAVGLE